MPETDDVSLWLQELSQNSSCAIDVIWQEYFEKLVHFAARRLGNTPRRDADEEDIALSAMMSFYRGAKAGRFPRLDDREDVWKILLTITVRKVQKRIRHQTTQKRGGGAVRGESVFDRKDSANAARGLADILGAEPTPSLVAAMDEQFRLLMEVLDDQQLRDIALLKFQGHSNEEIAATQKCALRTVERKLQLIRARWRDRADEDVDF
ncbi:MAG: RNA polymerase subunit sigma-70 [Planctomycetota bacterium]|nr:MAG: RNA polymerase subunit sigma-70 [Planctomycetota bacterium]